MQKIFSSAALHLGLQLKHCMALTCTAASLAMMGHGVSAKWQTLACDHYHPFLRVNWQHFLSWQGEYISSGSCCSTASHFIALTFQMEKNAVTLHNSLYVFKWELKRSLSWLLQVTRYKSCAQKTLNLELKHICLLLGQLSNFFSYCLH